MDIVAAVLKAIGTMIWNIYWGLAFGFILSSLIRAFVSTATISKKLGNHSAAGVGLATVFGAVSSSCSYAAASLARTLLLKGASWGNAIVFMIASTNLVFEIFIMIITVLGWAFGMGELAGGIIFIAITGFIITRLIPVHARPTTGSNDADTSKHQHHAHHGMNRFSKAAMYFTMDVNMVGKDILTGVIIAALLMNFVPADFWQSLFLTGNTHSLSFHVLAWNAVAGIFIAIISFVCSVGNILLAAVLWHGGISFGGVIAFILADLVTIPMLMVYRRYYGNKIMWKLLIILVTGIFFTALLIDYSFAWMGWVPPAPQEPLQADKNIFTWNRTTILNLVFIPVSLFYYFKGRAAAHKHSGKMEATKHQETN